MIPSLISLRHFPPAEHLNQFEVSERRDAKFAHWYRAEGSRPALRVRTGRQIPQPRSIFGRAASPSPPGAPASGPYWQVNRPLSKVEGMTTPLLAWAQMIWVYATKDGAVAVSMAPIANRWHIVYANRSDTSLFPRFFWAKLSSQLMTFEHDKSHPITTKQHQEQITAVYKMMTDTEKAIHRESCSGRPCYSTKWRIW